MLASAQSGLIHAGIGEAIVSDSPSATLVAANLGSCLGVAAYDPALKIGGMIHCFLPLSKSDPAKAAVNPTTYVDTGVPWLLNEMLRKGCNKERLFLAVAGGAAINDDNNFFEIGKKNYTVLRKVLWKNNLLIAAEDVGGAVSRTISLVVGNGEIHLKVSGAVTRMR